MMSKFKQFFPSRSAVDFDCMHRGQQVGAFNPARGRQSPKIVDNTGEQRARVVCWILVGEKKVISRATRSHWPVGCPSAHRRREGCLMGRADDSSIAYNLSNHVVASRQHSGPAQISGSG
jgi:hypothetical protein